MDFQKITDFLANDLFANFGDTASIAFVLFTLSAFILGFLMSAIGARRKRKKLQKELQDARHELNNTKAELGALTEQHELKTAALQKAELAVKDLQNKMKVMEGEKHQLHTDLYAANEEIEKLNASVQAYEGIIDDLNSQILGLKAKKGLLEGSGGNVSTDESLLNRLSALENKLNKLDSENEMLRTDLNKIKSATKPALTDAASADTTESVLSRVDRNEPATAEAPRLINAAQQKALDLIGNGIPAANGQKDDLSRLDGVGPFLENKLNSIGIFTFEQLSALDENTIPFVTEAIEFFPGRIEKDDWVGQARRLAGQASSSVHARIADSDKTEVQAKDVAVVSNAIIEGDAAIIENAEVDKKEVAAAAYFKKYKQNDLKIIEGIGPKISQILLDAGIDTWQKLAEYTADDLRVVLTQAGKRYRIYNPATWPQQAEFAANRNWKKLKEYQDYLVGGRDVTED